MNLEVEMKENTLTTQLLFLLKKFMQPRGLPQKEVDDALIDFIAECPDPVKARWLIVECLDPMTDEELVDRVLSMPVRPMSDVSTSIIPANHPARAPAN
jgi:hypothetical protein